MTANRDVARANRSAIRAIRQGKRIGLRGLSRQTGLNRGFLSQIELGRRGASARTLSRIAEALEVPVEAITIKGDA
ncbi:MAG TPA: helix-turn-helix transcriptional regulator [Trebonia sp.]|jgi:transcriptional regulator with XRE-family HTH domain